MEDKGSKDGAKRAALGETFGLEEESPCTIGFAVPIFIGSGIDKVKEREEAAEVRVGGKGSTCRFTGDGIEHVDNIKEEEGMGGGLAEGFQFGDVAIKKDLGEVDNGVKATMNANAKLTLRGEVGSKIMGEVGHDNRADDAAIASANANGAEFKKVGFIFMEGKEVVRTESVSDRVGEVAINDSLEFAAEEIKVGAGSVTRGISCLVEGKATEEVSVVGKGAASSSFADTFEGKEQGASADGEGFGGGSSGLGAGTGSGRGSRSVRGEGRGEKATDDVKVVGSVFSNWGITADAGESLVVGVIIDKFLGLSDGLGGNGEVSRVGGGSGGREVFGISVTWVMG